MTVVSSRFPFVLMRKTQKPMDDHEYRSAKSAEVVHNASKQRFEMDVDGQLSVLEYTFENHRLFLTHTEVPPGSSEPGFGYEAGSCRTGICAPEPANCPFVKEYVYSHPEYQSFVTTSVA